MEQMKEIVIMLQLAIIDDKMLSEYCRVQEGKICLSFIHNLIFGGKRPEDKEKLLVKIE